MLRSSSMATTRSPGRSTAQSNGTRSMYERVGFTYERPKGKGNCVMFDLMHLEDDLTELLGCAVDVVSLGGLLDRDDHIRLDAIPL